MDGMKYVLMACPGIGYGDSLCMLSIAQELKSAGNEVVVMATHGEVFMGQPGVDRVYWTGSALDFWERECSDSQTKVLTFPYWEITGRMRGLPLGLLDTLRGMAGLGPATVFPDMILPKDDVTFAAELREKLGRKYVVVHRGMGRAIKLLSMDMMGQVVNWLKEEYDVIQIGYPHDERIPGTLDLTKGTSFTRSAAVMAQAEFIVGHDSMPNHLSGIIEVPGVFVFGPTSPHDFGYAHNENVFNRLCSQEKCAPCGRPALWFYDYVAKDGGGYKDWDCPNRVCLNDVTLRDIQEACARLIVRKSEGIDWIPKRGSYEAR